LQYGSIAFKELGITPQNYKPYSWYHGNTVRTYLREYVSGGLDKVQEINFYRSESDLQDYKSNVCELHSFLRITSKIAPREFRCSNYSCFGQCTVSKM